MDAVDDDEVRALREEQVGARDGLQRTVGGMELLAACMQRR